MEKRCPARCSPELRQEIVELARSGRNVEELAAEFEIDPATIRHWLDPRTRKVRNGGLGCDELAELKRLRRENETLLMEREILSRVASWFIDEPATAQYADLASLRSGTYCGQYADLASLRSGTYCGQYADPASLRSGTYRGQYADLASLRSGTCCGPENGTQDP
jgi:transposase-like protein